MLEFNVFHFSFMGYCYDSIKGVKLRVSTVLLGLLFTDLIKNLFHAVK